MLKNQSFQSERLNDLMKNESTSNLLCLPDLLSSLVVEYAKSTNLKFPSQLLATFLNSLWEDYGVQRKDVFSLEEKVDHCLLPDKIKFFLKQLFKLIEIIRLENKNENLPKLDSPKEVQKIFYNMRYLDNELLKVVFLNNDNRLILSKDISLGIENQVWVKPNKIFTTALLSGCKKIILLHNHPSGNLEPSDADIVFTRKINQLAEVIGVKLLDHIIIGEGYYSFSENQLI